MAFIILPPSRACYQKLERRGSLIDRKAPVQSTQLLITAYLCSVPTPFKSKGALFNAVMKTFHGGNRSKHTLPFPTSTPPHTWGKLDEDGPSFLSCFLLHSGTSMIYGSEGRASQNQLFQLTFAVSFRVEVKSNGV